MIIEGDLTSEIELSSFDEQSGLMWQDDFHCIIIDKQQAAKLVEVLQKWLAGEEVV